MFPSRKRFWDLASVVSTLFFDVWRNVQRALLHVRLHLFQIYIKAIIPTYFILHNPRSDSENHTSDQAVNYSNSSSKEDLILLSLSSDSRYSTIDDVETTPAARIQGYTKRNTSSVDVFMETTSIALWVLQTIVNQWRDINKQKNQAVIRLDVFFLQSRVLFDMRSGKRQKIERIFERPSVRQTSQCDVMSRQIHFEGKTVSSRLKDTWSTLGSIVPCQNKDGSCQSRASPYASSRSTSDHIVNTRSVVNQQ